MYRSWLAGELMLVCVLGAGTALFAVTSSLDGYDAPAARIVLDTVVAVAATIVAILTSVRFVVGGRALDLLLATGFIVAGAGVFVFVIAPQLDGGGLPEPFVLAAVCTEVVAAGLIATAPFVERRVRSRPRALVGAGVFVVGALAIVALAVTAIGDAATLVSNGTRSTALMVAFALEAILALVAVIGFGLRYRRHGHDLDSWLALALTLVVFAQLHYVLSPSVQPQELVQGDFLRLLAYGILLVGVWRAISHAEFGRAVAEERARVAREIHDGLAQYLFAISAHVSMLESGASLDTILPRLKTASRAAQQEARFAVLALSSASGTAPFDAALRRYVEFLTADGALDVELDIDPEVRLAPDEQIEVFRIVQEGLANASRHGNASRADVTIGSHAGRRIVRVTDDGDGFDGEERAAGQGLKNMRQRAASIDGGFELTSAPGRGTAIEVVLRAA